MKPHKFPANFPFYRLRFNPPASWPSADLFHESVMQSILTTKLTTSFVRRNFHINEDGTLTPLSRVYEWQLAAIKASGRKTFRLTTY